MKYLKHFLLLSSFSFILFGADEEEIKTIVIDGVTYKINPASQNITPYDGLSTDNSIAAEVVAMQSSSDTMVNQSSSDVKENKRNVTVFLNAGQLMPINNKDHVDSGTSIGFSMNCPKTISLFNKE